MAQEVLSRSRPLPYRLGMECLEISETTRRDVDEINYRHYQTIQAR